MWSDTCTTAEDTRAAPKERTCTDPLSAGCRIYRSAVYGTLQSLTNVSMFCTNTAVCTRTMLLRTICFRCTRVDENIGDDRYRAKNAGHTLRRYACIANAADNNNEHYSSIERTARIFHMRIVPCLLLLSAHRAEHSWSRGNVGSHTAISAVRSSTRARCVHCCCCRAAGLWCCRKLEVSTACELCCYCCLGRGPRRNNACVEALTL